MVNIFQLANCECHNQMVPPVLIQMGVSENVVYPKKPNGFADHDSVFKWLFHAISLGR